ncbi:high affinity immunoglobulin gamma Fc receptor I-like isoform X1 [Pyxicephalus adspersus]|uniref:high affinity immunoglobulin gamma Fc receptor I-like isoform X1 n=1 Tax=Pyxicephalus adspersus TaxID=30357 RepID=UPI003B59F768
MPDFFLIAFLLLNLGKSGGAIRPVVTLAPNWGNILYYDNVTLTCDVPSTGPEEPRTYSWYRNKSLISGGQQRLQIISSSVQDTGDYQCQTGAGDISDPVFLNVSKNFVILQRPPSAIYEGDPLTLRCHSQKDFTAKNTKFYKDDKEMQSSDTDPELYIPIIHRNMSGMYKCTNRIQRKDSSTVSEHSDVFRMSVKELFSLPVIKVTPDRITEGGHMMVTCDTRPDPLRGGTKLHFAFYRDGRTVQEFNVSDTYRVRSAQLGDSGKYTCIVRTTSKTVRKMSDGFYIQIQQIQELFSHPEIKVSPERITEGGHMIVTCDTRPDPSRGGTKLQFAFYRDGRNVQEFSVSDTYRVRSAQLEDSGKYTCEVMTTSKTVRKMSDGFYIHIQDEKIQPGYIIAAVIGSLVVFIVSAVTVWKCKKRNQGQNQEMNTTAPTTDPDPESVCYTYLDISQLPKGPRMKHDELNVTYATVLNSDM